MAAVAQAVSNDDAQETIPALDKTSAALQPMKVHVYTEMPEGGNAPEMVPDGTQPQASPPIETPPYNAKVQNPPAAVGGRAEGTHLEGTGAVRAMLGRHEGCSCPQHVCLHNYGTCGSVPSVVLDIGDSEWEGLHASRGDWHNEYGKGHNG